MKSISSPLATKFPSCPSGVQGPAQLTPRSVYVTSTAPPSDKENATENDHSNRRKIAAGLERSYTDVAGLVDTNILVYRFDARFPAKQKRATALLRQGILDESLVVPHQALVEFVAVVTRPIVEGKPLLEIEDAHREVEDMLAQFPIIYPTENTLRTALRGAALYQMSWFDAHLWAYADEHWLDTLWSEDFEHGRLYGRVKIIDPFHTS
jgi:predicted nucleic acid-binding protein